MPEHQPRRAGAHYSDLRAGDVRCAHARIALLLPRAGYSLPVDHEAREPSEVGSRQLDPRGRRSLVTGTGLIVATVMPGFLTASLAPRIRTDFAFDDSTLGVAVALFYLVSASGSIPAGRLVDRVGATRGMWLGAVLTAFCCLAIAALARSAAAAAGNQHPDQCRRQCRRRDRL